MATPVAPAGRGKGKPVAKPPPLDDPLGDIMKSMSATRAVVKSVHNSIQPQRTTIAGVPLAVPGVAPTPEQRKQEEMKARAKFKEEVKQKLLEFLKESEEHELNATNPQSDYIEFPPAEDKLYRLIIHETADECGFVSYSFGPDPFRVTLAWKKENAPSEEALNVLREKYKPADPSAPSTVLPPQPTTTDTDFIVPPTKRRKTKVLPPPAHPYTQSSKYAKLEALNSMSAFHSLNEKKRERLTIEEIQARKRSKVDPSKVDDNQQT